MRIAYIVPAIVNRGPIIVVRDIIMSISKNNIDLITVFYLDNKHHEIDFPCKVEKLELFTLNKQLKGFDIIHSHMLRPDIFLALARVKDAKKMTTLHNFMFDDISNSHGKLWAKVIEKVWPVFIKRFDKIICLSYEMRTYYKKIGLNFDKLYVIYNGRPSLNTVYNRDIDENDKDIIQRFKEKYFVIGVSALLTKRKGIEQIIMALPYLKDYALLIIGDGSEKDSLLELSKEKGVNERCLFLGYRKDGFRYFSFFDAYCMPSRSEGFPLALLEAASSGIPSLVSDIGVFREIFTSDDVIFVKLDSLSSMIEGVQYMRLNYDKYSRNIYSVFKEKYTSQKMASNYLKVYEGF